jgi:uncharacterized iron-regulated membrane protein
MFDLEDREAVIADQSDRSRHENRWWKPRGSGIRGLLHSTHLLAGMLLCLPLALMGLTGSILVFQSSLDELLNPALYKVSGSGAEHSAGELLSAAAREVPPRYNPSMLIEPVAIGGPAVVRFAAEGKGRETSGRLELFVDPVSLTVLGMRDPATTLLNRIKLLHANLMIRGERGRQAAGWLGVVMLSLGLTGIVTWWPKTGRWRDSLLVRAGARGLPLYRSLHRVAGVWGLAIFITVSFGGVYLAFPQVVGKGVAKVMAARDLREAAAHLPVKPLTGVEPIAIDEAINLAHGAVADKRVRLIGFPSKPDQPIRVMLAKADEPDSSSLITVFVDQWNHSVLKVQDPQDYTAGEYFLSLQHSLHSGQGMGRTYKVLVLLCGLLPPLFAFTGINIWWKRRQARLAGVRTG